MAQRVSTAQRRRPHGLLQRGASHGAMPALGATLMALSVMAAGCDANDEDLAGRGGASPSGAPRDAGTEAPASADAGDASSRRDPSSSETGWRGDGASAAPSDGSTGSEQAQQPAPSAQNGPLDDEATSDDGDGDGASIPGDALTPVDGVAGDALPPPVLDAPPAADAARAPGADDDAIDSADGDHVDAAPDAAGAVEPWGDATAPQADTAIVPPPGSSLTNVVLNEVESSGGLPGDWVELFNAGATAVDVSGWIFQDSDPAHVYALPAGTSLDPGAYLVLEEAALGFGLGAADAARLSDKDGNPVASYSWPAHAPTTFGRCPNGAGAFAVTAMASKGEPNACAADGEGGTDGGFDDSDAALGLRTLAWPGSDEVTPVDPVGAYAGNVSGLAYARGVAPSPDTLWALQNDPSTLYQLQPTSSEPASWVSLTAEGWSAGKALRYPDGAGEPDAEGVTLAEDATPFAYVVAERDNLRGTVSRLSILRFDVRAPGVELIATHEWNVTGDLPASGANVGLEAITWVPDDDLVASGFVDQRTGELYQPARYPDHGGGIFFVGLEANGQIYAFALDHATGAAYRVAALSSRQPAIMDLAYDHDARRLWAWCDNTCGNRATVLALGAATGAIDSEPFALLVAYARPVGMANVNNEGIAIAPESTCVAGNKRFFWSDDSATDGHSIRAGTIACRAQL